MDEKEFSILIRFLKPNINEGHFFMSFKFIQIYLNLDLNLNVVARTLDTPKEGICPAGSVVSQSLSVF